jgi:undecaprenyl-diphosphatase
MLAHFSKDRWPQPSSVAALVAGLVAWRLPNFDPAAPRVAPPAIRTEVRAHAGLAAFLSSRVDPAAATGLALTLALALVLGGAVAIGALLVMVQHNAGLAHYDLGAARWGATHATSGSTRFLRDVSLLGGTPVMIAVAVIAAAAEYARTRTAAIFGFVTVVVGGQVVVTNVTKILVDRSRPDIHRLTGFSGASFPSGHAAWAAATFAAVAFLAGRGRSRRAKALLAAAAAGIAAGVAASRVLLGVHWSPMCSPASRSDGPGSRSLRSRSAGVCSRSGDPSRSRRRRRKPSTQFNKTESTKLKSRPRSDSARAASSKVFEGRQVVATRRLVP